MALLRHVITGANVTGTALAKSSNASVVRVKPGAAHIPKAGTKLYVLLAALLRGVEVDPGYAFTELNLSTLQARASELRKLGWPVRALERPHPRMPRETYTYYFLDIAFRRWMAQNPSLPPSAYPGQDGRGRYAASPG